MNPDESHERIENLTRISLRPLASPVPLGFFAFGIGSFLLSGLQLGWVAPEEGRYIAVILAAFVFPAEGLAAIFAFLARETLGATVLGLFSFSWLSMGAVMFLLPPQTPSGALGLLGLSLAAILVLLGTVAFLAKPVLGAVIVLASARFALNGFYDLFVVSTLQTISGVLGLIVALVALYGGLAFGLEDLQHRTVLPLGRRGEALGAFEGDLGDQLGPIEAEAGVRKQL